MAPTPDPVTLAQIPPVDSPTDPIKPFLDLNIGPNITIHNNNSQGADFHSLQLQTKSIVSASGLNIGSDSTSPKLTISKDGVVNTIGAISTLSSLNSYSLSVGAADQMTVSDTGLIYAANDLTIGSTGKFKVTALTGAVTAGPLTISGEISSTGTVSIGGTSESPAISLANTGAVYILGTTMLDNTLAVTGASTFANTLAVTGPSTFANTLSVAKATILSDTLAVTGSSTLANTLSVAKATILSDTLAVTKATILSDTLTVTKATILSDTLAVTNDLSVGGVGGKVVVKASTGAVSTFLPYSSYTQNLSSSETDFTIHSTSSTNEDEFFSSTTNTLLTTQEYVDRQIWNQTKRLNTILGKDSNELDNFNKVYEVITKIAGDSDLVTTLKDTHDKYGTLVDKTNEINTSMSDIVSFSYNDVLVRCSRSVWADECQPLPIPQTVTSKEEGWYFKNFVLGEKINFYIPSNGINMTIKDINQLFLNIFAVSNKVLPSIHFYTAPKANDNYWPIAHAKVAYYFDAPAPLQNDANKSYCLYTADKAPINIYNTTSVKTSSIATVNNTNRSTYTLGQSIDSTIVSPDDIVIFFAIHTNTTDTANDVEFVLNSFNVCIKTGTTKFSFTNSPVATNYLFNSSFNKHSDFSSMNAKEIAHLDHYTVQHIPTPSTI